jgi:hypothetical protein
MNQRFQSRLVSAPKMTERMLSSSSGIARAATLVKVSVKRPLNSIESICVPSFGLHVQRGYAFVPGAVREQIDLRFSAYPLVECSGLARVMARFVLEEANQLRQERQPVSRDDKLNLLDAAGEPPQCWICGLRLRPACGRIILDVAAAAAAQDLRGVHEAAAGAIRRRAPSGQRQTARYCWQFLGCEIALKLP